MDDSPGSGPSLPLAFSTAIRALVPVPQAERSSAPVQVDGFSQSKSPVEITTVLRPCASGLTGLPVIMAMVGPVSSGLSGWTDGYCSRVAALTISPNLTQSAPSSGVRFSPTCQPSKSTYIIPPQAMSTLTVPIVGTSTGTFRCSAKAGTFSNVTRVTLPSAQSARTLTSPAGASSVNSVTGSIIGRMPVSSSTVVTQIVFEPDMAGYSICSMMMKPMSASGSHRRHQQVAAEAGISARLPQHQPANFVLMVAQVLHLREDGVAGDRPDAAGDHPARFALGVGIDRGDHS